MTHAHTSGQRGARPQVSQEGKRSRETEGKGGDRRADSRMNPVDAVSLDVNQHPHCLSFSLPLTHA